MGKGYVEYSIIKPLHQDSSPVEVKCYTNGLWWVCPDPRDKQRCASVHAQYSSGYLISYETVRLTAQQLEQAAQ
jgi:hypothetical protein